MLRAFLLSENLGLLLLLKYFLEICSLSFDKVARILRQTRIPAAGSKLKES